jgi:hypothetical protein
MGKRSNFLRADRDYYATPAKAVAPLLRWLPRGTPFVEPCYGEGRLRWVLEGAGLQFAGGFDLPIDAREHDYGMKQGEIFITNPPYWGQPDDLHPLILNLSNQAPTWLLMSSDWLFNLSSGPIIAKRLRRIVAVGRVRWIPGSPSDGKDNSAWLLFYRYGRRATFIGRANGQSRQRTLVS